METTTFVLRDEMPETDPDTDARLVAQHRSAFLRALSLAKEFVGMVAKISDEFGLLSMRVNEAVRLGKPIDGTLPATEVLREGWNEQAPTWLVVESAFAYALTMQTLLQFLRPDPKQLQQNILSLGAGPGVYETYLALRLAVDAPKQRYRMQCIDFSPCMVAEHQRILRIMRQLEGHPIKNITASAGDMTKLAMPSGCIDHAVINNSLQWVPEWRIAVQEVRRVLRPSGPRMAHLLIHMNPMVVRDQHMQPIAAVSDCTLPKLLDVLESEHFQVCHMRHIRGEPGTGQMGAAIDRVYIMARHEPSDRVLSWNDRELQHITTEVPLP